ncbi:MAG: hypothetical protein HGB11_12520 [Chlorobiales bacterium]|nr:hypothetical protein [Chlorobiales bacterium]
MRVLHVGLTGKQHIAQIASLCGGDVAALYIERAKLLVSMKPKGAEFALPAVFA